MTLLDFFALAKHHMPAFSKQIDGFVADITNYPELVGTATGSDGYNYVAPEPVEKLYEVIILEKQKPDFPKKTILHYEYWQGGPGKLCYETSAIRCMHKYVDLFVVTAGEVLPGESFYDSNSEKIGKMVFLTTPNATRKRIAFSSTEIEYEIPCPDGINGCEVLHMKALPVLSEAFIEKFIENYNSEAQVFYTLEQIQI